MTGFVLLHRSLLGHPAFRNDSEAMAFAWMTLRASWQPCRVRYKGRSVDLVRGQLCVSQRDMAEALDRDKGWIERLWKRLICEAMIEARREAAAMVITICNYDKYQALGNEGKAASEALQAGSKRQTQGRRKAQNNEGNEGIPPKGGERARAIALPPNFAPLLTDAMQAVVDGWSPGMFDREYAQFVNHHSAHGSTMKDWQAAFRTWLTNADKWSKERNGSYRNGTGAHSPTGDGFSRALQRAAEHFGPDDFG